jgi:hypothetical protein
VAKVGNATAQGNSGSTRNTDRHEELGDFTTTSRTLPISALAMGIGALCAFVALALLRLIGLISLTDLLKARTRHLEEEVRREQVISLRFFLPGGGAKDETETPATP